MSGARADERSGLSLVLVTRTASVQFSKFAADTMEVRFIRAVVCDIPHGRRI
jgi:hypothetical protein